MKKEFSKVIVITAVLIALLNNGIYWFAIFKGFEPIPTMIEWYEPDGSYQCRWVYVIDENS